MKVKMKVIIPDHRGNAEFSFTLSENGVSDEKSYNLCLWCGERTENLRFCKRLHLIKYLQNKRTK